MRCRQAGCSELVSGAKYCSKHLNNNSVSNKRSDTWYDAAWNKFSLWLRRKNPQCQRIINGYQCFRPSDLVHHLISPRVDMTRKLDPTNCVALCRACHPDTEGTPHWREGVDFVPTVADLHL
jgi:HNH endonuclease